MGSVDFIHLGKDVDHNLLDVAIAIAANNLGYEARSRDLASDSMSIVAGDRDYDKKYNSTEVIMNKGRESAFKVSFSKKNGTSAGFGDLQLWPKHTSQQNIDEFVEELEKYL